MIVNIRNAAKYLGITERTVYNLINEGIFPKPKETFSIDGKGKIVRSWEEEELDKFRPQLRKRGKPKKNRDTQQVS